jgi:hypothetical protein
VAFLSQFPHWVLPSKPGQRGARTFLNRIEHGSGGQHSGWKDLQPGDFWGDFAQRGGVVLFEPNPLDLVQDSCLALFAADFVLHLAVVPSPRKTLFSFTGLIDLSAVLFFFVLQGVTPLL